MLIKIEEADWNCDGFNHKSNRNHKYSLETRGGMDDSTKVQSMFLSDADHLKEYHTSLNASGIGAKSVGVLPPRNHWYLRTSSPSLPRFVKLKWQWHGSSSNGWST